MSYLDRVAEEIRAEVPADLIPPDAAALFLIYAVLARAKGQQTTAEDVHDAWTAWMSGMGEEHQSMRPFAELDAAVRQEDEPFLGAIHRVSRRLEGGDSRS